MDFSWLSNLFSQSPNLTTGASPATWTPQTGPPSPMGAMPVSPEMGGGPGRMLGMQAVDALGPGGGNVNQASAVMAGQTPGFGDKLKDTLGIGTPGGMSEADAKKMMDGLLKMMAAQQAQQKGQGGASAMAPMPVQQMQAAPMPQAQRPLPRYPWSPRSAPAGLLYDGP